VLVTANYSKPASLEERSEKHTKSVNMQTIYALTLTLLARGTAAFAPSVAAPLRAPSHVAAPPQARATLLMQETATTTAAGLDGVRPDLAAAFGRVPPLVDEDAELAKATFPIPPDTLIGLTKAWLASQVDDDGMDWFAEDFRFVAPVVGPFDKAEFTDSLKGFEIQKAFPDLNANPHHFRVCPFEPNRVWWSVKYVGTNTGPIFGGPATMKCVESPVQAQSVMFNERGEFTLTLTLTLTLEPQPQTPNPNPNPTLHYPLGEITKFTIGYVLDKETGNTGGLGGVFGLFYAIGRGLPFPEAQPWKASPIYGAGMGFNKQIQSAFKANPSVKEAFFTAVSSVGKR